MYGIAPTLGFAATGKAAGAARSAIGEAAKLKRAPTLAELATFRAELECLRADAAGELKTFSNSAKFKVP